MGTEEREDLRADLLEELLLEERLTRAAEEDKFSAYTPNDVQWRALNSRAHETLLSGPNQCGKTENLRFKAAAHLTGRYPKGWYGHKFDKPIVAAIGGETAQTTRDHLVNPLLGDPHERGMGYLPSDTFDPSEHVVRMSGAVAHTVDYFLVRHETDGKFDGWSKCYIFTYSKGWERLQGYKLDWIGIDEEPPENVYNELKARTNFTMGYMDITMSPLKGTTELYLSFEEDSSGDKSLITYTIDDATHLSTEQDSFIRNRWKGHPQEEARLWGRPCRGAGTIYPFPDQTLLIENFQVPTYWPQIIGVDFPHGVGTFAAVRLALDPDSGTLYLTAEYKDEARELPHYAARLKSMGGGAIPVAWPHDGGRVHIDGSTIALRYKREGCQLLPEPAHYVDGSGKKTFAVMSIIEDLSQRMAEGRFRVFQSCHEFLREKRLYQHKDGKVAPKQDDHLIDACHKAVMMIRHASPPSAKLSSGGRLKGRIYEFFRH